MNKTNRSLGTSTATAKRWRKSKPLFTVRVLPPVDGATLALAKLMQAAHDFDEAVWSGRVRPPRSGGDRQVS